MDFVLFEVIKQLAGPSKELNHCLLGSSGPWVEYLDVDTLWEARESHKNHGLPVR